MLALLAATPDGLTTAEIAERIGDSRSNASNALQGPWFEKADPDYLRSPWVLTEAGEKAAGESSQTPARET